MIFLEISEKEYEKFWNSYENRCFLSSIELGSLRKDKGWNVKYVGLKENTKLVACAMLLFRKRHFNKYEYYAMRGPLIDYKDENIIKNFFESLKKYIKDNQGYVLRIDPNIIDITRDIDGNPIKNKEDNSDFVKTLKSIGFKKNTHGEQNDTMFSLNLENKTEEEILNEMKPNTRATIKKVEKNNIKIKELKYDDLNLFYDILLKTGKRKDFTVRSLDYYKQMYNKLYDKGYVKFLVTELDLKENLNLLNDNLQKKETELASLSDAKYNDGKRKNIQNEIESIKRKTEYTKSIMETSQKDKIIMSASMFVLMKPEIVYLSSGNDEEYMNYNSQFLLQWEMIKYAIKNGFKKYNFYGIITYNDKNNKDYGVYEFKRGFNGYVEKLIGEYEMPISKEYYIINLYNKLKRIIKR